MSPWPTVIAGAVGVVFGSGGTLGGAWLTARSQINSQRLSITASTNAARHAHKRQVYGAFVGALTMFIGEVVKMRTALQGGRPGETPLDRQPKLDAAADTLGMVLGDLILAAPPIVRSAGEEAAQFAYDVLAAPPPSGPPQAIVRMPQGYMDLANKLVALMQADLGELPHIAEVSPLS